ncbi:MAG: hypothetical protein ACOCP4_04565, partial [Candidatus Woesearchaeota archaeon]
VSDGQDYDTQSYVLTVKDVQDENTAPEVTIKYPDEGQTFDNKEITAEFDVFDAEDNLESCEYSLNNDENKSISCSEETNTLEIEADEGSNTLTIYANDSKGKTGSDSVSFNVDLDEDTTPPEITVVSPEQGKSYHEDTELKFLVYLDEEGYVNYSLNGEENKSLDKDEKVFTSDFMDLEEGNHEVTFYAKDEAGNKANKTVEFKISGEDDGEDGNTGTGDSDENDICYKRINGHCLTYEDYLYYKQHSGNNPIYINQTDSEDSSEDKGVEINWLKVVLWILLIGVITLFLILIRYAWKAVYLENKNKHHK